MVVVSFVVNAAYRLVKYNLFYPYGKVFEMFFTQKVFYIKLYDTVLQDEHLGLLRTHGHDSAVANHDAVEEADSDDAA